MSLSRLAVLAVFFMMVMSAFVTIPTYNVGADNHEEGGPYLNAFPTGSGGDPEDYEMSLDVSEGGANITVEATELIDDTSYTISWEIFALDDTFGAGGYWDFSGGSSSASVQYFIGPDVLNDSDFGPGCYMFSGWLFDNDAGVNIENESWPFTLDVPFSDCEGMDECPFDSDNPDSPCNSEECDDNNESDACQDIIDNYCANHDDPGCYWDDDGGNGPSEAYIDVNMIDLATWEVYVTTTMDPMWSDDMRAEIAHRCAEMSGESSYDVINEVCFNNWVANFSINEHHDVHYGGHGGDGCPPEMSEDLCAEFKEVCVDGNMSLSCFGFMASYCNDDNDDPMCQEFNSNDDEGGCMDYDDENGNGAYDEGEHCYDDEEDDGFFMFLNALFDYEDGNIGPEDYLAIVDSLFDFEGPEDYGQSALYDAQTLTITTDEEGIYSLHPNFGSYSDGSHTFVCGNGDEIPFYFVNDDNGDCPDGADEQWYDSGTPDETSDDCQMWNDDECEGNFVNWYDCHDGSEIWVVAVNNGEDNCSEGEDEYHEPDYWYGHVFLYTGHFNEVPDSTENLVGAASEVCDYVDDDEVYVFCELAWDGYMEAGNYTVVTAGGCYTEYNEEDDEEELHCEDYGDYNHSLTNETGDLVGWIESAVEENDTLMTMTGEHYNARDDSRSNFPLYDAYELTVGDDGFNGSIISAHYNCSDHDGDGEYDEGCNNGYDMSIYLYEHSFDPAHSFENLMASNNEIDGDGLDCPADEELFEEGEGCSYSGLQVDLTSGDYVVVTTSRGFSNDKGFYKNDLVRGEDGEIIETWDGDLIAPYWDCCDDDNNSFIVDGDDRTHMPWPWMYDDSDHGGDEGDDPFFEWTMQIIANLTAWKDDSSTAADAADSIVDLVYWAAETGLLFDERGDGPSFVCGNGEEIPFDLVNDGVEDCADGSDEQQYDEDGQEINWFDCYDGSEVWIHQVNDGVEDCADGEDEGYYHDDGGEGCPFDSPGFCGYIGPYCDDDPNNTDYDPWRCGSESAHYCLEDGADDEGCAYDDIEDDCEDGEANQEICEAFFNFDHDAYHGYGDDGTDDDSPVTLDGVAGVEDPADWDDMLTPSSENVLGILSDNEGLPIMLHSSFTITFDETYPDNGNHVFVIPSNADPDEDEYDDDGFDWQITFRVTEDYEIYSCTGCYADSYHDDGRAISFTMNDGVTHDIVITFSSAEDLCPFYSEAGMAFCVEQEEEGAPCSEDVGEANGAACAHVVIDFCAANEDEGCAEFFDEGSEEEPTIVWWCGSEYFEDEAGDWDRGFCGVLTAEPEPEPEPEPDCDVTVGVDATGEAFDTPSVKIEFGQTVCWQWEGTEMGHNVVQVAESGNTTMLSNGFYSGDPSDTVDYRVTFDAAGGYSDDTSYYYICEPHVTVGMVGEVVVGTGSTDEELAAIEEGLPSVSFVVGSLVLVGAAGLRRRIH